MKQPKITSDITKKKQIVSVRCCNFCSKELLDTLVVDNIGENPQFIGSDRVEPHKKRTQYAEQGYNTYLISCKLPYCLSTICKDRIEAIRNLQRFNVIKHLLFLRISCAQNLQVTWATSPLKTCGLRINGLIRTFNDTGKAGGTWNGFTSITLKVFSYSIRSSAKVVPEPTSCVILPTHTG